MLFHHFDFLFLAEGQRLHEWSLVCQGDIVHQPTIVHAVIESATVSGVIKIIIFILYVFDNTFLVFAFIFYLVAVITWVVTFISWIRELNNIVFVKFQIGFHLHWSRKISDQSIWISDLLQDLIDVQFLGELSSALFKDSLPDHERALPNAFAA